MRRIDGAPAPCRGPATGADVDAQLTRTLDLRDYGRIIRASSRLIVATAVLVGVLSATYVVVRGPEYTATARVLVESIVPPAMRIAHHTRHHLLGYLERHRNTSHS